MKAITNKTKKVTTPAYTVDITKCDNCLEVAVAIALAKQEAGLPLTSKNLASVIDYAIDLTKEICISPVVIIKQAPVKKAPWYKRFWNWLTGKNK